MKDNYIEENIYSIVFTDKEYLYFIFWEEWCVIWNFVKRSDVTRWKQGYIRPPPPYFIVLDSSVKKKGGQGNWVSQNRIFLI